VQGAFFTFAVVGSIVFAHDGITAVALVVLIDSVACALAITPALVRSTIRKSV
jgi:hypothetical protein